MTETVTDKQPLLVHYSTEERELLRHFREEMAEVLPRRYSETFYAREAVRFVLADPILAKRLRKQVLKSAVTPSPAIQRVTTAK
jgi:hypothetical protein